MANMISSCCKATVQMGRRPNEFHSLDIIECCGDCGQEVEDIIETCEYCGEPAEQFIETRLGGICQTCYELDAEDLMDLMARQGEAV